MPPTDSLLASLPTGSRYEEIAYVPAGTPTPNDLLQFPHALQRKAVFVKSDTAADQIADVALLIIPSSTMPDEQALPDIRDWVEKAENGGKPTAMVMSLQHVQIIWSPRRIVIIAEGDRLETVRAALVEVTYYISELNNVEQELAELWPQLEADMPMAFEYDQQASRERRKLLQRFEEVFMLRSRLARTTPYLLSPHTYPPTLASQVGERLRERVRVEEREEFVSDQLEVFENVYEMCGQRANDYQHASKGHTLEWIIIVLLGAEVFLMVFDYLTIAGS